MKSGNLNFLETSGPLQACNGTALPLPKERGEKKEILHGRKPQKVAVPHSKAFQELCKESVDMNLQRQQNNSEWR